MSTAPVLDGIHHLKLPVVDLDRSLAWYQENLGYGVMTEFVEDGVLMGVAMTHPNGGPDLALRYDPDRTRAAAGFDYFAVGVPGHEALEALAAHLADRGVDHDGVHRTPVGWVLLGVRDPDGHDVRFYTVPLELPDEAFLQAYRGENRVRHRGSALA